MARSQHLSKATRFASTFFIVSSAVALAKSPPATEISFKKTQLTELYYSEGASMADLNADGHMDVIAGPRWWAGPDFRNSYSYAPVKSYPTTGPGLSAYSNYFFTFPTELTNDKWVDLIKVGIPGRAGELAINPGADPLAPDNTQHACQHCKIVDSVCNESPQFINVIGDEKKELLSFSKNHITLSVPSHDPKEPWVLHHISPPEKRFQKYAHGLGAGDINGDGLMDILEKSGWWQQPQNWDKKAPWVFHPYDFASGQMGGAQMFTYDVDGDGDNDVVSSHNGHGYGFSWHEQITINRKLGFQQHIVMTDKASDNPYGVSFSQLHAMDCVDIDGDGIKDIVTGKCYFAHNGRDPGAKEPAVLYWFKTHRHSNGQAELIPYQIDDNSGVGRQITTGDLNQDGKPDIVVSNKKGVFTFIQQ